MIRFGIVVGIALVSCGINASPLLNHQADPKITLTVQATDATKALQQLSDASQIRLFTTPQTASEVITFRFKDVPLSEAMKRIAEAVDGTWKQEGETYLLVRTSDQQRAEREAEFKQDVETIKKSIQIRADELAKMHPWSGSEADLLATKLQTLIKGFNPNSAANNFYQQASQLSEQAPIGRAMSQVAALMDPKDLAGLPPYYKTVWSTNPTATQRPLPPGVLPIFDQYIANQAQWTAAIESHHLKPPTINGTTYWVGDLGDLQDPESNGDNGNTASTGKVAVILLSAQKWSKAPQFNLELSAYDDKGKRIGQAQSSLTLDYDTYTESMKDVPIAPGEKTIKADADAAALLASSPQYPARASKPLSSDLISKITHPEIYDPLRFFLSPSIVQAAEIKDANMVACLADNVYYSGLMGTAKEVSVDRFLQRLNFFFTQATLKDGWLIVKPTRASESREDHTDRKELGRYLRRIASGQPLSIDERAAFALALPDQQENYLPSAMANYLHAPITDYFEPTMLRLYGLMTAEQKTRMSAEGLPFEALSDKQLECVNRMVYGVNANLQYNPPQNRQGSFEQADWNLFYNGLMREPTESLPSGIPAKGMLKLKSDNSYVVMASGSQQQQFGMQGRELDPNSLAWQKYSQEHPDIFPWMNDEMQKVDLARVQYGQRLQMTFTFQFTSALTLTHTFEEHSQDAFKTMALEDLPDTFKKQFNEAYANLVQSYANVKPGQFGIPGRGTNPPP